VLISSWHWTVSCTRWMLTKYFFKFNFKIILPITPQHPKWSLLFRFSDKNFIFISHVSCECYILRPSHSPWFHRPIMESTNPSIRHHLFVLGTWQYNIIELASQHRSYVYLWSHVLIDSWPSVIRNVPLSSPDRNLAPLTKVSSGFPEVRKKLP
jgi:hypothetical protein